MRVRLVGPFCQNTGYSRAFHDYALALHTVGAQFEIVPLLECDTDNLDPRYAALIPHATTPIDDYTHIIVHAPPYAAHEFVSGDLAPPEGVKKACITTWETTTMPSKFVYELEDAFDLIIVPSLFNRDVFVDSGGHRDSVAVVPHAFDPSFWHPTECSNVRSAFSFYTICDWSERKNPIGLLKAYFAAFRNTNDVVLRILTPFYNVEDYGALKRAFEPGTLPRVEFVGGQDDGEVFPIRHLKRMTDTELRDFHRASDCYITASRGEGWGLGAFEAMLVGNAVIAPGWSGFPDFLGDYSRRYVVSGTMTPCVTPEPKTAEPVQVGGFTVPPEPLTAPLGYRGNQSWFEPDLHKLQQHMWKAYEEWLVNKRRAYKDTRHHARAVARFGLDAIGERLVSCLQRL